ncbi:MAG: hypothetical protein FWF34_00770 [Alphaproteobacteria bacterium]|nr:hypothetical protein [Alphaproteobacteria bacterium]MCL2889779.1 hypothetical protein [Alphaproteobacteria bacterium]
MYVQRCAWVLKKAWLDYRKKQIDRANAAVSFSSIENYSISFRNHFNSFYKKFPKYVGRVFDWKNLDRLARIKYIEKLVPYVLKFGKITRDVTVKFPGSYHGALASTNGREMSFYDKLLDSDDHDEIIESIAHESQHVYQIRNTETALTPDIVAASTQNYIQPHENMEYYLKNPIEIEAFKTGRKVGRRFTDALRQKYGFDRGRAG